MDTTPAPTLWQRLRLALTGGTAALWRFLVGAHGFELDTAARARVALAFLVAALAGGWLTAKALAAWAVLQPTPDSPAWELALLARMTLFRAKVAAGLALGVLLLAWAAFQALDRTRLGKRLWHWSPGMDSDATSAAKTLVAGLAFVALLLAFGLLAGQVLR
jgi:hypothetical protein